MTPRPRYTSMPDQLAISDTNWLTLGQLRSLVEEADARSWGNDCLVSHSAGRDHIRRHDVRTAQTIVVEGYDA